jgi:hypothetical protein
MKEREMKFILMIAILLLLTIPGFGQITDYKDISELLDGTFWADSVTSTEGVSSIYDVDKSLNNRERYIVSYLTSADSSADTIQTKAIENRAYGDHFISYALTSDSSGARNPDTVAAVLEMGVFRGYGTVAGTAAGTIDNNGILWKNIARFALVEVSGEVSLKDSTWWTDFPASHYWFRVRETTEQSNDYYINDFQFKQD